MLYHHQIKTSSLVSVQGYPIYIGVIDDQHEALARDDGVYVVFSGSKTVRFPWPHIIKLCRSMLMIETMTSRLLGCYHQSHSYHNPQSSAYSKSSPSLEMTVGMSAISKSQRSGDHTAP